MQILERDIENLGYLEGEKCLNALGGFVRAIENLLHDWDKEVSSLKAEIKEVQQVKEKQEEEIQLQNQQIRKLKAETAMHQQHQKNYISPQQENLIVLQNSHLNMKIEQLLKDIEQLKSGGEKFQLLEQIQELKTYSETKISDYKSRLNDSQSEIIRKNVVIVALTSQLQKLDEQFKETEREMILYKNQYIEIQNKYTKENYHMLNEDFMGYQIKVQFERTQILRLQEQNRALKSKVDKYIVQRSKEVDIPESEIYEERDQFVLQSLTEHFKYDKSRTRNIMKDQNKMVENDPMGIKIIENFQKKSGSSDKQDGGQQLHILQNQRPTFYELIQSGFSQYEVDFKNIKTRPISTSFIGTLRSILDSKYNEFLIDKNRGQISQFPDFVFSWLGRFTVDDYTKKTRSFQNIIRELTREEMQSSEDNRIIFLLDLLNPKLHVVWEIFNFREFFCEKALNDELYFYLHCRNLIMEGPSMNRLDSAFDLVQYVRYSRVKEVVQLILKNYETQNIDFVKKQLMVKIKSKTRNQHELIDPAFVLRILMQFYRIEKQNRYSIIKAGFQSLQSIGKDGKFRVNFDKFQKLMNLNYPRAPDIEIASIYRNMYQYGINVDSFFMVAHETGFFIKYMRLPSQLTTQAYLDQKYEFKSEIQTNYQYQKFFEFYETNEYQFNQVFDKGKQLGVEQFTNEIDEVQKLIQKKFFQDLSEQFKGGGLLFFIQRIKDITSMTKNIAIFEKLQIKLYDDILDFEQNIFMDMASMDSQLMVYEKIRSLDILEEETKNQKATKLQKAIIRKLTKFYLFIKNLISNKVKQHHILND